MLFGRPWRHGWRHHGKWEGGVPPMFDEWHKRAHEGNASADAKK
jgi:hypothetical protein